MPQNDRVPEEEEGVRFQEQGAQSQTAQVFA